MKALVTADFSDQGLALLRGHMEVVHEPWGRWFYADAVWSTPAGLLREILQGIYAGRIDGMACRSYFTYPPVSGVRMETESPA